MPINHLTDNDSIRACFKAQESTSKIDDDFVDDLGDIDLTPIPETIDDVLSAFDADEARDTDWSEKVTAGPVKPLSEKVTRRFRASDAHDKEIIERIQKFRVPTVTSETSSLVEIFTPSKTTPITTTTDTPKAIEKVPAKTSTAVRAHPVAANDNLPDWEFTRARAKLTLANEALWVLEGSGASPVSWSLNLSPDRIEQAQGHPKGFVDCMKRYIDRALKRSLGSIPLYWFIVDIEGQRLHLHGGILASSNDLPGIEEAMCHAGGEWTSAKGRRHQFHFNRDRCDSGWIGYPLKNKGRVKRSITGPLYTITTPLRREAEWTYTTIRQIMRRPR